jgi:dipeptidyl aminopeptidase/acylaminoacyl peptidase
MMKIYKAMLTAVIVIYFVFPVYISADELKPITAVDMWNVKRVGTPVVSPDGESILFSVTEYDILENKGTTNIYMLPPGGSEPRQFTRHPASDSSPIWSPDGKQIAFISRREGNTSQIFLMPTQGGEPRQLTDLPVSVSSLQWFPDGNRIAFVAAVYPEYNGDFTVLKTIIDEKKKSKVSAKTTENRIYRHWDRWLTDGMHPRLFAIDVKNGEVNDLMPDVNSFFSLMGGAEYDISPDGSEIAVSMNTTHPPYDYMNYDIYLVSTDGSGVIRNITEDNPANDLRPRYSSDGSSILYGMQRLTDFYADKVRLVRYDRTTEAKSVLTEDIDLSVSQWIWTEDGRTIFFLAEDRGKQSIFSISSQGGNVTEVFRGGTNSGVQLLAQNRLVFQHQNLSQPTELYEVQRNGQNLKKLTHFNDALLAGIEFGEVEDVVYKGADGTDVQMYIVYPPDFDSTKRWPLVHMIHGGPHGIFGDSFHFRWNAHLFAAPGYVVAMPNFHGSTSFGQEFTKSIHGAHADKPFRDIMKATDYMLERGFIDENKMAATGGSYGGYLVSWIAGHTNRFAALVNHAGVYNIMGQFASDITAHREAAYSGSPWDGLEELQKWNPAVHAGNFETPMLIIHGELDYRVPVTQGLEVYGVLKGKGVDARLVYYPDENHWVLTPQNSIYWYEELYGWLSRYIGKGPGN